MTRFLLIGSGGFIGSHLYRSLQGKHPVLGTRSASFDLARDRILDQLPPDWRDADGPKFAVLSAAVVPMDRCRTEESHARAVMVDGTRRCAADLADAGFTPVFLSTSYVFDGARGGYTESDAPAPLGRYGALKLEMERWLLSELPQSLVLRLDKTAAADLRPGHALTDWARAVRAGEEIRCIRDQVFGLTLVDDVARILVRASGEGLRGLWHLANPEPRSRAAIVRSLADAMGLDARIVELPMDAFGFPEARPMSSWLDSRRILDRLGECFCPVDRMIERVAEAAA
jgi:dTDP-4-dehydrorhamnose reductase